MPTTSLPPLTGVWVRSLLALPDGTTDTTTSVTWVQAGRWFVDLRQGEDGTQEGFAGHTSLDEDVCTWHRQLDLSPPSPLGDVGRLWVNDEGALVEDGVEAEYTEHWHNRADPDPAWASAALEGPAFVVRVGDVLATATGAFPDAVISLSRHDGDGWVVERSSDPARVGGPLTLSVGATAARLDGQVFAVVSVEGDPGLLT